MKSLTLLQISDTHLSKKRAYAQKNWEATLRYIEYAKPDLVVHTGDVVLDDPDDEEDLEYGYSQLQRIPAPWKVVPGGHDLGDSPPDPWMGQYITPTRRERFLELYKDDHWSMPFGDWVFVGLNCQLFASTLQAEEEQQWAFLESELVKAGKKTISLFFHKPPCRISFSEPGDSVSFIPSASRKRFLDLVKKFPIRLMITGHRHTYITFLSHQVTVVCGPTTGLLDEEDNHPSQEGILRNGLVAYSFNQQGVTYRLVEPPGVGYIQYHNLDPKIITGSRFLPLFKYEKDKNE